MTHPRNALGVFPSTGPSPDTKGPGGPFVPGEGPGHRPGAACKARQRPDKARSAAAAWLQRFMHRKSRDTRRSN